MLWQGLHAKAELMDPEHETAVEMRQRMLALSSKVTAFPEIVTTSQLHSLSSNASTD